MSQEIDHLLYKIFKLKEQESGEEHLICTIGCKHETTRNLDARGKENRHEIIILEIVNITMSLLAGDFVYQQFVVDDLEEFTANLEEANSGEFANQLLVFNGVMQLYLQEVIERTSNISKTMSVMNNLSVDPADIENSVNKKELYDDLVYNTIENLPEKLDKETIDTIGKILIKIVIDNSTVNVEDVTTKQMLVENISEKVIPELQKAKGISKTDFSDLTFNLDPIIEQIKYYQNLC